MGRQLDTATLTVAALHLAREFIGPDILHPHVEGRMVGGRLYTLEHLFKFTFADEFDFLLPAVRGFLGPDAGFQPRRLKRR